MKPIQKNTLIFHVALGFVFCGVSCQRTQGPLSPQGATASSEASPGSGWLARLTGFQETLEAQSAQRAAAEAAAKRAELEANAVRVQLDVQRESTHEARQGLSFWRVAAAILGALALVAIFVGAALGSSARRQSRVRSSSSNEAQFPDTDAYSTAA